MKYNEELLMTRYDKLEARYLKAIQLLLDARAEFVGTSGYPPITPMLVVDIDRAVEEARTQHRIRIVNEKLERL